MALLAIGAPGLASQPEETLPGLKLSTPLMVGQIDNVNPYSGDPGITIPLGPEYPLGPGNTFQLVALHSSKHWHFDSDLCGVPLRNHAAVIGYPTLGIGWSLELGWVGTDADGFAYHSPTGRHRLSGGSGVWMTHDGSRLRVKSVTSPTGYTVEFPDGTVHRLDHLYSPARATSGSSDDFSDWDHGATPGTRYGLRTVTDSFGTLLVTVAYVAASGPSAWMVDKIDLSNPARSIDYVWTTQTIVGIQWPVLQSVSFPTSAGTLIAAFSFRAPQSVTRNLYDSSAGSSGSCPTVPADVRVPFLATIALQDDAPTPTTLARYDFVYGQTVGPITPDDVLINITLPTNGQIAYNYDHSGGHCVVGGCPDPETGQPTLPEEPREPSIHPALDSSAYVVKRTTIDPFTNVTSVIDFARQTTEQTPGGLAFRWALVTEPSGNGTGVLRTRHVYFTRDIDDTDGIEVERRFYAENNDGTGTPIRTVVNCYETDSTSSPICGYRTAAGVVNNYGSGINVRLQKEVTWYGVNPQGGGTCPSGITQCKQGSSSTWVAAAGRYQTTTVTTNLTSMTGWTGRTATTLWNPQTGTDWLLDLFTSKTTTDSGSSLPTPSSATSTYTFILTDGFLSEILTNGAGGGSLSRDAVSTSGNPTQTTVSGKGPNMSGSFTDDQTFKSGLLSSRQRSGIGWKSFDVDRADSTGLVTASRDPNSLQTSYVYDRLNRITSITPAGEDPTTACYLPPVNAYPWFVIVKKGTAAACSKNDGVPIAGSGGVEGYQYDGFGRVIREVRRLPNPSPNGGYFVRRESRYDNAGHIVSKSEWTTCEVPTSMPDWASTDISICADTMPAPASPPFSTAFSNFDPFGRARHVARPDGTSMDYDFTDGTIAHSDTLQKAIVHGVAGGDAVSYSRRDALGRVIEVQEPDVTGESTVKTSYKYNVFDKLAEVKQPGAGTTAGTTQTRSFTYDNYGFLKSEVHPEKYDFSTSAAVTTSYTPDALGNVTQKVDGGSAPSSQSAITYAYTYDAMGRLTQATAAGQKYVVNCYDGATTCDGFSTYGAPTGDKAKGQETFSVGYNFIPTVATVVTEEYKYESSSGRLSGLITTPGDLPIAGASPPPEPYKLTQTWSYNTLGLIDTYGHPRASGSFSETTEYKSGLPTKITANGTQVVKAVTYNPAGGIASWTAGNTGTSIVTTITQDPSYMPRPEAIKIQGSSTLFEIQAYAYDGAGNVTQMKYSPTSKDDFTYDARSRLTNAALVEGTRAFTCDRFGNLTKNGATTFTMNASRNQISSGSAAYDSRGNLTNYGGVEALWYDALNRQTREIKGTDVDQTYLYDGVGERTLKTLTKFSVLRREMARYIAEANIIAKGWSLPAPCPSAFPGDVDCNTDPDAAHIKLIVQQNITAGCGGTNYCPNTALTRAQMAVLFVRAYRSPSYIPPTAIGIFTDVPPGSFGADYIEQLYTDGVTAGCGGGNYCPNANIGEWEMLVFLSKAPDVTAGGYLWGGYHPAPRGSTFFYRDSGARLVTEAATGLTGVATASAPIGRDNVFLGDLLVASYVSSSAYGVIGWQYYFSDHIGSPRIVTNSGGAVVESRKYWPYGEAAITENSTQGLRFATMERDAEGDHFYDHARLHDAALGRFLRPDPLINTRRAIPNPQMWNRYTYGLNNPLKYVDPTGRDVSISISFKGDFTDEQKKRIIANVQSAFQNLNVGKVYVFDAATLKQSGNIFEKLGRALAGAAGRGNITVTDKSGDTDNAKVVFAGNFLKDPSLSEAQRDQAIANAVFHETFVHQFGLGLGGGFQLDRAIFARDSTYRFNEAVTSRYGTVVDSNVAVDPSTRELMFSGPLAVVPEDVHKAQEELRQYQIDPPVPRD